MKLQWLLLVAAIALVVADDPSEPLAGVVDLTPDNFKTIIDGSKAALVEFYAPWCGHCKSLAPEWGKLGKIVAGSSEKNNLVVAKVDANAHSSLGSEFGVQGFPTIKFFPKGKASDPEEYSGGRTAEDFIAFFNQKTGSKLFIPREPSDVVDLTSANFDKIVKDSTKDVLVEFYAPWCGHCKKLTPEYEKVGATYKSDPSIVVAKMDSDNAANKAVSAKYGVSGFPTIKWFPKTNKDGEEYNSGRSAEDFVKFINEKTGSQRQLGGLLGAKAGRTDELDTLASEFASSGDKAAVLAKLKKAAADSADGSLYVKAAEKIQEKGAEYVDKEQARLNKLIDGGNVAADKLDAFVKRRNVLDAFKA